MSKLVIRNGRLIDPANRKDLVCDVAIVDGRVAAVGANLEIAGAQEFDASGMIVARSVCRRGFKEVACACGGPVFKMGRDEKRGPARRCCWRIHFDLPDAQY